MNLMINFNLKIEKNSYTIYQLEIQYVDIYKILLDFMVTSVEVLWTNEDETNNSKKLVIVLK